MTTTLTQRGHASPEMSVHVRLEYAVPTVYVMENAILAKGSEGRLISSIVSLFMNARGISTIGVRLATGKVT